MLKERYFVECFLERNLVLCNLEIAVFISTFNHMEISGAEETIGGLCSIGL